MLSYNSNDPKYLNIFLTSKRLYKELFKSLYQPIQQLQDEIQVPRSTFISLRICTFCEKTMKEDDALQKYCEWDSFPRGMYVHCNDAKCNILLCQSYFNATLHNNQICLVPISWVCTEAFNLRFHQEKDVVIPRTNGSQSIGYISCDVGYLLPKPDGLYIYTSFMDQEENKVKWVDINILYSFNASNAMLGKLIEKLNSTETDFSFDPYTRVQREFITKTLNRS